MDIIVCIVHFRIGLIMKPSQRHQTLNGWKEQLHALRGAYSENTIRAYRADFADFEEWCLAASAVSLPALPETLATYVEAMALVKTPATVARRLAGIGRVHRLLGHANPGASDVVALALRRIFRSKGRRQKQAAGLSAILRDKLRGLRNHA